MSSLDLPNQRRFPRAVAFCNRVFCCSADAIPDASVTPSNAPAPSPGTPVPSFGTPAPLSGTPDPSPGTPYTPVPTPGTPGTLAPSFGAPSPPSGTLVPSSGTSTLPSPPLGEEEKRKLDGKRDADLVALIVAMGLQKHSFLSKLIKTVNEMCKKDATKKYGTPLATCANFAVDLVQFSDVSADSTKPENAVRAFLLTLAGVQTSIQQGDQQEVIQVEIDRSILDIRAKFAGPGLGTHVANTSGPQISTVLGALGTGADILKAACNIVPPISFLGPVASLVSGLLHMASKMQSNRLELSNLAYDVGEIVLYLADQWPGDSEYPPKLDGLVSEFMEELQGLSELCKKVGGNSLVMQAIQPASFEEEVKDIRSKLNKAKEVFKGKVVLINSATLHEINKNLKPDISLMDDLHKAIDFSGAERPYLEHSRDGDLEDIREWIKRADSLQLVLWIHGAAGAGKSTLAQHFTKELRDRGQLITYLPMSDGRIGDWGPETAVKAISADLGRTHPEAIPAIRLAMKEYSGPGISNAMLVQQYIRAPLMHLRSSAKAQRRIRFPLIAVVDAIDEWIGSFPDGQKESYRLFLDSLSSLADDCHLIKFIILARKGLDKEAPKFMTDHALRPVEMETMERYFRDELKDVVWETKTQPPSDQRWIPKLAKMADGLFLWARMACSIIESPLKGSPQSNLAAVMQGGMGSKVQPLDDFYRRAVEHSFPEPTDIEALRSHLLAITVIERPLPIAGFAKLMGLEKSVVEAIQTRLRVFQIRQPTNPDIIDPAKAVFHLSFIEFYQRFYKPMLTGGDVAREAHKLLGEACARILCLAKRSRGLALHPCEDYVMAHWISHVANGAHIHEQESRATVSALIQGVTLGVLAEWIQHVRADQAFTSPPPEHAKGKGAESPKEGGEDNPSLLLRDLGVDMYCSSQWDGWQRNLALGVSCLEVAVCLQPESPEIWCRLGWAYSKLGEHTDSVHYLEEALKTYRTGITTLERRGVQQGHGSPRTTQDMTSNGGSHTLVLADLSYALGTALYLRYHRTGCQKDLKESVSCLGKATSLFPEKHENLSLSRKTLLTSLQASDGVGRECNSELESTISLYRRSLESSPTATSTTGQLSCRHYLAECLLLQAIHLGPPGCRKEDRAKALACVGEAYQEGRGALALCPEGDTRWRHVQTVASCLHFRYILTGKMNDLDEAIDLAQGTTYVGQDLSDRCKWLDSRATYLWTRFRDHASPNPADLDAAHGYYKEASGLCPQAHPDYLSYLTNLGNSYLNLYLQPPHSSKNLEEAISYHAKVNENLPRGHHFLRGASFGNTAKCFFESYQHSESSEQADRDLDQAIDWYQAAIEAFEGYPDIIVLNNLAACLHLRFERGYQGSIENDSIDVTSRVPVTSMDDLNRSIQKREVIIKVLSLQDRSRPLIISDLCYSLGCRYQVQKSDTDRQGAITQCQAALDGLPPTYPHRAIIVARLAFALHLGSSEDPNNLDESLRRLREAIGPAQPSESHPIVTRILVTTLLHRFERFGKREELEEAISTCKEALSQYASRRAYARDRDQLVDLQAQLANAQMNATSQGLFNDSEGACRTPL